MKVRSWKYEFAVRRSRITPPVLRRLRVLVVSLKHQREIKHRIGVVWRGSHCVIAVEKLPSRYAFRNKKAGTMTRW